MLDERIGLLSIVDAARIRHVTGRRRLIEAAIHCVQFIGRLHRTIDDGMKTAKTVPEG
jgi:hypothetical protein